MGGEEGEKIPSSSSFESGVRKKEKVQLGGKRGERSLITVSLEGYIGARRHQGYSPFASGEHALPQVMDVYQLNYLSSSK